MAKTKMGNHGLACGIWLLILIFGAIPAIGAQGVSSKPNDTGAPVQISVNPNRVDFATQAGSTADLTFDIAVSSSDGGPLNYTAAVQSGGAWL